MNEADTATYRAERLARANPQEPQIGVSHTTEVIAYYVPWSQMMYSVELDTAGMDLS